jgi:hypothetical protein
MAWPAAALRGAGLPLEVSVTFDVGIAVVRRRHADARPCEYDI